MSIIKSKVRQSWKSKGNIYQWCEINIYKKNEVFDEDEADTFGTGNYSYSTYEENEGIQETDILPGIESNESKTLFGRKRIDEIIQELDALDLE